MGKLSRNKGAGWERECCQRLEKATGLPHSRNLTETRTGNAGDINPEYDMTFQCKVGARPPVWNAIKEAAAVENIRPEGNRIPVALIKRNSAGGGVPPEELVILRMSDFLPILRLLVETGHV